MAQYECDKCDSKMRVYSVYYNSFLRMKFIKAVCKNDKCQYNSYFSLIDLGEYKLSPFNKNKNKQMYLLTLKDTLTRITYELQKTEL